MPDAKIFTAFSLQNWRPPGHPLTLIIRGWRLSSKTWNPITSPWMKQLTWLIIIYFKNRCLRLVLRTPSGGGACHIVGSSRLTNYQRPLHEQLFLECARDRSVPSHPWKQNPAWASGHDGRLWALPSCCQLVLQWLLLAGQHHESKTNNRSSTHRYTLSVWCPSVRLSRASDILQPANCNNY